MISLTFLRQRDDLLTVTHWSLVIGNLLNHLSSQSDETNNYCMCKTTKQDNICLTLFSCNEECLMRICFAKSHLETTQTKSCPNGGLNQQASQKSEFIGGYCSIVVYPIGTYKHHLKQKPGIDEDEIELTYEVAVVDDTSFLLQFWTWGITNMLHLIRTFEQLMRFKFTGKFYPSGNNGDLREQSRFEKFTIESMSISGKQARYYSNLKKQKRSYFQNGVLKRHRQNMFFLPIYTYTSRWPLTDPWTALTEPLEPNRKRNRTEKGTEPVEEPRLTEIGTGNGFWELGVCCDRASNVCWVLAHDMLVAKSQNC